MSVSANHTAIIFAEIPHSQAYELLVATIQPRPIAFVSTMSREGHLNLAPFSFFTIGGSNPPSIVFSPTLGPNGAKDTLRNIEETREYVVNLVHRDLSDRMNLTSKGLAHDVSEWDVAGIASVPSLKVKPPRVEDSLVQFECRLHEVCSHGIGPGAARYVIGEVIVAHIASDALDGHNIRNEKLRPIARMGGANYLDTDALEFFQMTRPE